MTHPYGRSIWLDVHVTNRMNESVYLLLQVTVIEAFSSNERILVGTDIPLMIPLYDRAV